jgi:hypothetical protein
MRQCWTHQVVAWVEDKVLPCMAVAVGTMVVAVSTEATGMVHQDTMAVPPLPMVVVVVVVAAMVVQLADEEEATVGVSMTTVGGGAAPVVAARTAGTHKDLDTNVILVPMCRNRDSCKSSRKI